LPNPWRGFKKCLTGIPEGVTHQVVLQDDTIVCKNFVPAVERVAAARPDNIVCLFIAAHPRRTANQVLASKKPFVRVNVIDFVPVVATIWPIDVAISFLQWAADHPLRLPGGDKARSDDAVLGRWMKFNLSTVYCTVPSLVEHPDDVPSTIGRAAHAGKDKGRVALRYIGDADPLEIDWSVQ